MYRNIKKSVLLSCHFRGGRGTLPGIDQPRQRLPGESVERRYAEPLLGNPAG